METTLALVISTVAAVAFGICWFFRWLLSQTPNGMDPDLRGQVYVVTGCGSGVGRAAAVELARRGATVVLANRAPDRSDACKAAVAQACPEALGRVHHITCDLSDMRSVHAFVTTFLKRFDRLDCLLNVAGYMDWYRKPQASPQGLELHFATNFLGHFALCMGLRPALAAAHGRIVNVGSCSYILDNKIRFDSLTYEDAVKNNLHGLMAYAHSKICITAITHVLAERLARSGILVVAADPGVIRSLITRRFPWVIHKLWNILPIATTPLGGAQTPLYCAWQERTKLIPGECYRNCKHLELAPTRVEHNKKACERLYTVATDMLQNLYYPACA